MWYLVRATAYVRVVVINKYETMSKWSLNGENKLLTPLPPSRISNELIRGWTWGSRMTTEHLPAWPGNYLKVHSILTCHKYVKSQACILLAAEQNQMPWNDRSVPTNREYNYHIQCYIHCCLLLSKQLTPVTVCISFWEVQNEVFYPDVMHAHSDKKLEPVYLKLLKYCYFRI
jgi:hypothetical protein